MAVYSRGGVYWFNFVFDGRKIQRSTKQGNRKAAIDIEAAFRTALAKGEVGLLDRERFTVSELLDRLKQRWELEAKLSPQNASLLKKAKAAFLGKMADELSVSDLEKYAARNSKAEYANATVNRVFQCLRRAYKLAGVPWPKIEPLNERDNVREGFLSAEQMSKLLAVLPDDGLRDYVEFCWCTGMRKSEAASLRWAFLHDGQIVVPQEFCKSRKPHVIPVAGTLTAILKRREATRSFQLNGVTQLSEYVFHRGDGLPVAEFRKSWKTACKKAGVGNALFHDLRRSAVRDLIRAGVSQSVAMKISGHRTSAVFQRYDIVVGEDMKQALEKTAAYRAG